jgi:triosephosphate isomerase
LRLIVGNWKANGTESEARALSGALPPPPPGVEVVVCPPFTALAAARAALPPGVALGAQDVSAADGGAFTGEVTAAMLLDAGCRLALVGHSERRQHFRETDADAAAKLAACWRARLLPLLCVGETASERAAGMTEAVLGRQVGLALKGAAPAPLWIAYEPVWAIGTGAAATPQDCAGGLRAIRGALAATWPGASVPLLYGGSVNPANCAAFWGAGGADGALVGGASLDAGAFAAICRAAGGG